MLCATFANDPWDHTLGLTVSPGTAVKEPSRAKVGTATRSRLSQRMRLPSGYVRGLFLSIAAAFVRVITGQLNRCVLGGSPTETITAAKYLVFG